MILVLDVNRLHPSILRVKLHILVLWIRFQALILPPVGFDTSLRFC